uniref:Ubiquitin extension protein n=1 Tax=Rhizophora mucronata TaxID=61149 RepID=A0A2P2PUK7_RHIMU
MIPARFIGLGRSAPTPSAGPAPSWPTISIGTIAASVALLMFTIKLMAIRLFYFNY